MFDWVLVGWFAANVAGAGVLAAFTTSDYAVLIPLVCTSLAQAIVMVIHALQNRDIRRSLNMPSSDRTIGQTVEGIEVSAHAAAVEASRVRKAVVPGVPAPPLAPPAPPT